MDYAEAIEVIKSNYPPSNYTMLREALDLAIDVLQDKINEIEYQKFLDGLTELPPRKVIYSTGIVTKVSRTDEKLEDLE